MLNSSVVLCCSAILLCTTQMKVWFLLLHERSSVTRVKVSISSAHVSVIGTCARDKDKTVKVMCDTSQLYS